MLRCARCLRPLLREPVIVNGQGYGPACSLKVAQPGDLFTASKGRTKRAVTVGRKRRQQSHPDLFGASA